MNKKIVILLLTIVHWSTTQAQFTDNFSDDNFNNNPSWFGDEAKFIIENQQLRLLAPAESSSAYMATSSTAIVNGSWGFYVKMNFNPSAGNLARVYLVSDQQNLGGNLNGYYVQLGGTDDEVSLYRQTGSTRTKIIDGQNGALNLPAPELKVRVTRDENGKWELFSDVSITNSFFKEGEVVDTTHPASNFFGVYCLYTSTRSTSFYFDDFVVTGEAFTPPSPSEWKDVILTEIFADPSSSNGLPNAEFVELFNRTNAAINLNGWRLSDPSSGGNLSGPIEPNEYIIVTTTAAKSDFEPFGKVLGISGFPTLNNAGDILVLKDNLGNTVDSVSYSDSWYKDSGKRSGGWSLELIDPENPCGESDNWIASENPTGGTPGKQNSVFANKPDLTPPFLVSVIAQSPTRIMLTFNEKLKDEIPDVVNFQITPDLEIASLHVGNTARTQLELTLNQALKNEIVYTLVVSGIRDCNGNTMGENVFTFGLPEEAAPLDVVINEILFNPRPTGVDFVELYNPTSKYFNLKNWGIGNWENDHATNVRTITGGDLILGPKEYRVITTDPATIISHYPLAVRKNIVQAPLPSMPDNEGSVVLMDQDQLFIDNLKYKDDQHSIFIKNDDGVSLERIDPQSPSESWANWKSASSTVGYATPGYLNSNSHANPVSLQGEVTVTPEIFIPITGQPDFTEIHYQFDQGGWVANVKIINSQGVLIKQIANNELLGTQGFFRWDGDQEGGSKARVGYYVVWFQVYHTTGKVQTLKKRVVVGAKF